MRKLTILVIVIISYKYYVYIVYQIFLPSSADLKIQVHMYYRAYRKQLKNTIHMLLIFGGLECLCNSIKFNYCRCNKQLHRSKEPISCLVIQQVELIFSSFLIQHKIIFYQQQFQEPCNKFLIFFMNENFLSLITKKINKNRKCLMPRNTSKRVNIL